MKNVIKMLVAVAVLGLAVSSFAQTNKTENQGSWVLGVGGGGNTATVDNGASAFGLTVDIARTGHLLTPIQTGVRQSIAYVNVDGSQTLLTTVLYNDWTVLTYKRVDLFAGANVGVTYGNTKPLWVLAPEAGLRWLLKEDVALVGRIQYGFDLNNNAHQQNSLGYEVSIQFKF